MIGQQLQDPYEPPRAGHRAVVLFELGSELGEAGREFPIPEHRSMVQRAWLATEGRKVVEWVEDQGVELRRARVGRDDLATGHHDDSVYVSLNRHHLECEPPRDAVPVTLERDCLILVHRSCGTDHAR